MSWGHNKRGDPCVGDPRGMRGDEPHSVHLPHLLPLLPAHVKKASEHAPTTYVPHKTCHSTTTPRLNPAATLVPILDTHLFACMPAWALAAAAVHLAGGSWYPTLPAPPNQRERMRPAQQKDENHQVEMSKAGSNGPTGLLSTQRARLNGTAGGRKTQCKVDNAQCGVDQTNARSNGPNASADS